MSDNQELRMTVETDYGTFVSSTEHGPDEVQRRLRALARTVATAHRDCHSAWDGLTVKIEWRNVGDAS